MQSEGQPSSDQASAGAAALGASAAGDAEALAHFHAALDSGRHWYVALLEAVGLWTSAEETRDGRPMRYLVSGEAFDWRLLARRICETANGLLPAEEVSALLDDARPPLVITPQQFRRLVGPAKYRAHLNFWYGVVVEEALVAAVAEEVRKENTLRPHIAWDKLVEAAHHRVYGASRAELEAQLRAEQGVPALAEEQADERELRYWLFNERLRNHDPARIASDTLKGIDYLRRTSHALRIAYTSCHISNDGPALL